MPPHDWTDRRGWYGMSLLLVAEIARDLRGRLADGDRAVLGWEYWYGGDSDPKEKDVFVGVERAGRRVAAVELVPPEYGRIPVVRSRYDRRFDAHLRDGVHLLVADLHPRPVDDSTGAAGLPTLVPPAVAGYRSSADDPVATWLCPLVVGETLPVVRLRLSAGETVSLDLEATYTRAARYCYLE